MLAFMFVWLASVVASMTAFFGWISAIGFAYLGLVVLAGFPDTLVNPLQKRAGKWIFASALSCAFIANILPSEKTMYIMAGAYVGQQALESDAAKNIGKIVEKKLETYLEELENKVEFPRIQQTQE